jgi:hypothetical protein
LQFFRAKVRSEPTIPDLVTIDSNEIENKFDCISEVFSSLVANVSLADVVDCDTNIPVAENMVEISAISTDSFDIEDLLLRLAQEEDSSEELETIPPDKLNVFDAIEAIENVKFFCLQCDIESYRLQMLRDLNNLNNDLYNFPKKLVQKKLNL